MNNIWVMIQKEYWCLIWNMNMQSASSIWSNLLSNVTVNIIGIVRNCVRGGEANVYGSSYYWNFRTSSFKQVACLILLKNGIMLKKHTHTKKNTKKLSLQLFLMANFDRVNGPIDMRVWKGRRFENILKLDRDLR